MLEDFLDSVDHFSDEEEDHSNKIQRVHSTYPSKTLDIVIIVPTPFQSAVQHLLTETAPYEIILSDTNSVGVMYERDSCGFILLKEDMRFSVSDLVECNHIIVLSSVQCLDESITNSVCSLSDDESMVGKLSPASDTTAVGAGAAHHLTESISKNSHNCTILVDRRSSTRVELDSIIRLWTALSGLLPSFDGSLETVARDFKRQFPINRKVPMYS
jgi:hypothetical protein